MKTFFTALLGFILGGIVVAWLLPTRPRAEKAKEPEHEHEAADARVEHGTNGEVLIKLSKEIQAKMGLATTQLIAMTAAQDVRGYGRVLDPAPLSAILAEIQSATAALEASKREHDRLKILNAQDQNASARSLEAAQAAMKRDHILLETSRLRLATGWGSAVADRPDLPELVSQLSRQERALAQISLPLGSPEPGSPVVGRLASVGNDTEIIKSEYVGLAPIADSQTQGRSYLFLASTPELRPGVPLVAWLQLSGEPAKGVLAPNSSVLRHEGETFVYIQSADDAYMRVGVELDRPSEGGWLVREGLQPGGRIVIAGAQQLLSEELKGKGGEE
ncbi:MAG: hypothetical protein HYR88_00870 [Verrucomicrobia bacterium]|nr:hypothetical protein [Verrucomicrobiota bacterium]MBI3868963.1 hypothetical protein [Verrucomicrobiota bacterium]